MGDELSYLQNEIDGIAQTLKTKFPQTTPRYGLVLYKDQADVYLTRWFDFKGLDEFRANLAVQTVGGGGDYPEAVAAGLDQMMKLSWRTGAVSRMTFWVADAPHHIGDEALGEGLDRRRPRRRTSTSIPSPRADRTRAPSSRCARPRR